MVFLIRLIRVLITPITANTRKKAGWMDATETTKDILDIISYNLLTKLVHQRKAKYLTEIVNPTE